MKGLAVPSRSPLVGREREVETLGRLLEQARAGRGAVALIEGEPGIGKTRLLAEMVGSAAALGFDVARGAGQAADVRARSTGADRAYHAIAEPGILPPR